MPSVSKDVEQMECLCTTCRLEYKLFQLLWNTVCKNMNINITYNQENLFLAIYSTETSVYVYKKTYTRIFIAILLIIEKKGNFAH